MLKLNLSRSVEHILESTGENYSPKSAIQMVYSDNGGIMKATSLGQLPRNRQKVSNIRRSVGFQVPMCSKKRFE